MVAGDGRLCSVCNRLSPRVASTVYKWHVSRPFQRLHLDWCHVAQVGDTFIGYWLLAQGIHKSENSYLFFSREWFGQWSLCK